ncbi:PAS domain-containing sensor histidine kinase [Actinoplanes sp. CA-142083]|uniref:PAS domain-containing sensor histidine kinase n=1 Tax=Actinoplanes sp. CA-142083 TaxID=3239903 RepID=UPI003D8C26EE
MTWEFEQYLALSPDMVILAGYDGFWKRINPAVEAILGYPEQAALARPFLELIHPDDRAGAREQLRRAAGGAQPFTYETRMVCADGSIRRIEWTATPFPGQSVLYGVGRDVTELRRTEREQAELRRIATLVAEGARPAEVLAAVTAAVAATFDAITGVLRFEHDPSEVVLAGASDEIGIPVGTRWATDDALAAAAVHRTGSSSRIDPLEWSAAASEIADEVHRLGIVSTVASPIVVEGELWGVMTVNSREELPPDTARRLGNFTDLVTTAIANAESRSQLAASRRRIVAASDEARRTIERNLHDGTQQRLVSLALAVRAAEANLPPERDDLRAQLSEVEAGLVAAVDELRELARGIHPAILSRGGLGPALRALARRSAIPAGLEIALDVRPAEPIEAAAYFVASESLANAAKHSRAARVEVSLVRRGQILVLTVHDDGAGGADPRGSGLVGLRDRVEALGGSMRVDSPPGGGTRITAELPLELKPPA